jgi:glycolate oxidase FAD binding subunit
VLDAGVGVAEAQTAFAGARQTLAIDAPLGAEDKATIGGLMATGDSGPLRHRYGTMRDLVVGVTVALSDGTLASSGGRVIKNVAGYDLAKLLIGSHGTLGLIVRAAVRLHPLPDTTATAVGHAGSAEALGAAAAAMARLPLEADCLDADWRDGAGRLLVRFSGASAAGQADAAAARLRDAGLTDAGTTGDDDELWAAQRAHQRADPAEGCVVKVSGRPADLARICAAADAAAGSLVARAGVGIAFVTLPPALDAVASLRAALAPRACTVLDGPPEVRAAAWAEPDRGAQLVMGRVKDRFDPARIFRPGAFVGGI